MKNKIFNRSYRRQRRAVAQGGLEKNWSKGVLEKRGACSKSSRKRIQTRNDSPGALGPNPGEYSFCFPRFRFVIVRATLLSMTWRTKAIAAATFAGLVALCIFLASEDRGEGPIYHGKPLSHWVDIYGAPGNGPRDPESEDA